MTVKVASNAAGDHAVGVEVDGVFVPLATVPAHRVQHAVDRQRDLEAKAANDDENAQKALDEGFVVGGSKSKPEDEKGGGS